ncbi:sporulation protein YpjB [Paenibacillus sp. sptzw28]|uniref:sporulation protein YpjB n=1 Tax=Paenibacillus sp. sptzw28 TaxID=715179 RepID=UPI001C6F1D8C|nr:sporulation protein YpjB [Paenibacillus sp. sptzw28]QYR19881.1 sporulation protein YpjB [Paenibacillus sp. sptzw28]
MRTSSMLWLLLFLAVLIIAASGCGGKQTTDLTGGRLEEPVAAAGPNTLPEGTMRLGKLSEQLYAAANSGNRQLAYSLAARLEKQAESPDIRKLGTAEGWEAFDRSLIEARQLLSRQGASLQWYGQAARLKLAADALIGPGAPLWLQYEDVLHDDWNRMRQAWHSQNGNHAASALEAIKIYSEHVQRFELAALMQRPAILVTSLQEQIRYTERILESSRRADGNSEAVIAAFDSLNQAANRLFGRMNDVETIIGPAGGITRNTGGTIGEQMAVLFISAFVMSILGFAGWRKYAYERHHGVSAVPKKIDEGKRFL